MTLFREMADYPPGAVPVDVTVHGVGMFSFSQLDFVYPITMYLCALLTMFGVSTVYNLWPRTRLKRLLWRMDHCGIVVFATIACSLFVTTSLTPRAITLIVTGFGVYVLGLIFLLWNNFRFHNAIWHSFVLLAAYIHYEALLP
jgi:predicted membrane channel-forming protein YqfA (hemolysin III family)